jgi:hypothetical protein
MRRGLLAVVATGCLSVPPYAPEISVSYTERGTGGVAAGPGFALQFADGDGFHFPDALTIDGGDVLGRDPAARCFDQDQAGFQIAPTPRISANSGAEPVVNRLVPVLRGPAVVQATVEWASPACNNAREPGGISTFTVFPDGRIVRHDALSDPSSSDIGALACACGPGEDAFTVSTFWTFATGRFSAFHDVDTRQRTSLPGPSDTPITNQAAGCLDGNGYHLAVAWRDNIGTTILGRDTVLAFDRTMVFRASQLEAYTWEDSTAIVIDRTSCDAAFTRALEHSQPSALSINDAPAMPGIRDGIYASDGAPLTTARVVLTGTVNSSFAVWLRFPQPVEALRASRELATGAWYLPQQVNDREWIVWFRDSMASGQTIVVEPR